MNDDDFVPEVPKYVFNEYEEVRKTGKYIMFYPEAREQTSLTRQEWVYIMENYKNLKSQCYYILAKKINEGQIGITCPDINIKEYIIEELEQVRIKNQDKDTKLQIVAKDTIKALIGRSPDYADALAMRMYYEIKPSGKYFVQ